jgi:hypothetical protein
LAYSFRRLFAYRFIAEERPDIIVDVFDMGCARDAFGVFCAEREGPDIGLGQGSEYDGGLLRFWKGRYFVSTVTHEESDLSAKAVRSLGATIVQGIQETGTLPDLIERLPPDGLVPETIKYFRSHQLLNMHYYVAAENILGLSQDSDAVLARYEAGDGQPFLLLVKYPSAVHAEWARGHFKEIYMPDAEADAVRIENGKWTAVQLSGSLLAIVFDAASRTAAEQLLSEIQD